MHPQKVMKNMTTPTTMRITAGSMRNVSRTVSVVRKKHRKSLLIDPHTSEEHTQNSCHTCRLLNFGIYPNGYNKERKHLKKK